MEASAGHKEFRIEYRLRRRDGEYRWAIDAASPRFSGEGEFLGYIGSVIDITERKQAEETLFNLNETLKQRVEAEIEARGDAEKALRQAQKMESLGQLTGGIAHDFNNMLNVVIGNLDMLLRRLARGDSNVQRFASFALDGATRAAQLTERLLAFARQQPLRPEPINANKLVAGMSDLLHRTLGETIRTETVLAGGLWKIHTDGNQLESAILNLAVNARDAMPEGGKLTVETANAHLDDSYAAQHAGVPQGQYVMIAVTDTGCGMSAGHHPESVRSVLHDQIGGQRHGPGLEPGARLRASVRRSREDLQRDRSRHDGEDLSAALLRLDRGCPARARASHRRCRGPARPSWWSKTRKACDT